MWQKAMRRRRYFLDRTEDVAIRQEQQKSRDWLYESYYCMSQQHPLIVFLLLIVMGACLALLAVFFASGLGIEDHVAFLITVPTALAIFFAIFVLVCIESVFKKLLRIFSLVIWVCLVAMGYLFMCFGGIISPWDQILNEKNKTLSGTSGQLASSEESLTEDSLLSSLPESSGKS